MTDEAIEECAAALAMRILGKKWTMNILCELMMCQELFFTEIQERILGNYGEKISARVLSESLKGLESNEIITRKVHSDKMPINVGYSLTEKGEDFAVVLSTLKGWGLKWGGITVKKCRSYACVHNALPAVDIDEVRGLFGIDDCIDEEGS